MGERIKSMCIILIWKYVGNNDTTIRNALINTRDMTLYSNPECKAVQFHMTDIWDYVMPHLLCYVRELLLTFDAKELNGILAQKFQDSCNVMTDQEFLDKVHLRIPSKHVRKCKLSGMHKLSQMERKIRTLFRVNRGLQEKLKCVTKEKDDLIDSMCKKKTKCVSKTGKADNILHPY